MTESAYSPQRWDVSPQVQQWALVLLLVAVYLSLFGAIIPSSRYLKYAALPVLLLLYIGGLRDVRRPPIYIKPYTLPFLILLLAYAVFLPRINSFGVKDMLFTACFVAFFTLFADRKVSTRLLNFGLLVVFAILVLWRERTGSFSLTESTAFAESTLSFVFGLFAVFALLKKRYLWFLVNVLAVILSLKRIALLGVIVAVAVMLLPRSLRRLVTHPVVACILNLLAVALLVVLGTGEFEDFLIDRYGISISLLTMGRSVIHAEAAQRIMADPLTISLFGAGPGASYETLSMLVANLHSDVLKIFYELGALWLVAFIFALYAVKDVRLRVLALYLNVIILTDNILVYVDVMVFYMILAAQLLLVDTPFRRVTDEGGSGARIVTGELA